jgi:hypothetical protein
VRPSNLGSCACALWLALGGSLYAQIGGIEPEDPGVRPEQQSAARRAGDSGVQQAAHYQTETIPAGEEIIAGEEIYYDDGGMGFGDEFGAAMGPAACNFCGTRGNGCGPFGQGCLGGLYVRGEYLLWGTRGMNLPPLVTTSPDGTPRADAGVLGEDGTRILFGGNTVGSDLRSGGRITFGRWLDPCQRLGVEADFWAIDDESTSFGASSTGDPILARPFYDIIQGFESSSLVAFPNVIQGTIAAEHVTSFQGAGVRALYNLCCGDGAGTSCFNHCPVHTGYRYDLLVGYRFLRLDDRLGIIEDSTSLETQNPGSFFIRDLFDTENSFHGFDLGSQLSFCKGCWSLDLLSKVALGNTRSIVTIDGDTVITDNGTSERFQGGLLAQRTNIGSYTSDEFAVVPELGVNVGYQINPCWRVTLGYTFIYWSRVARAGDQIDRDLNANLLPPEGPQETTHLRPEFNLLYSDLWAQGMNVGLEGRW